MRNRPHEVTASHLRRLGVIYLRQSTQKQVTENAGSADFQRAQEEYANSWGWLPELIETIDDLGLSFARIIDHPGGRVCHNH